MPFYNPRKHRKTRDFSMLLGGIKREIEPKWVKQLEYRREWYNLMLLA